MIIKREPECILVTGGAGFIGSHFVELCVKQGLRIIVLDAITYAGNEENLADIRGDGTYTLIKGNICDAKTVSELFLAYQFDALVNFAAESHVDRSISGPSQFIQTNIVGTYTLLESSRRYWSTLNETKKNQFMYVQISTDEVFGSLGVEGKFSETTPVQPNSPYSASKAAGDNLVRAWHHTYGLPTIVTHCSNNYGPKQYPEKLIPFMMLSALNNKPLGVYGTGLNVRDWIHVKDHCEGIFLALTIGRSGQTYCFGGNAEKTNLDVVKNICKILDTIKPRSDKKPHDTAIQFVQDRQGHDWRYAIDSTFAQKELGFKCKFRFDHEALGLLETIRWYLDNPKWLESIKRKQELYERDHFSRRERDTPLPAHTSNEQTTFTSIR
ncbi:MAG: dTDP-glucose 4,6-dehydratase [Deltaproteobacteria bacterium]|nr:dTDP-glucose 4,6-dehydratase [Deltaproteobacteria bacterium]